MQAEVIFLIYSLLTVNCQLVILLGIGIIEMDIACSLLVLIANNRFGRYKMSQSNLSIALCIAIVKFNMWKYLG